MDNKTITSTFNHIKSLFLATLLVLATIISIPSSASAGNVTLKDATKALPLSSAIIQFQDKTGSPSAPQALNYFKQQKHIDVLQPNNNNALVFDGGKTTYWLQFTVTNKTDSEEWVLSLGDLFNGMSLIANHISVYEGDNHTPIAVISKNSSEENRTRVNGTAVSFSLSPNITRTITLRVDTTKSIPFVIAPELVERGVYSAQLTQQKLIVSGLVILCIAFVAMALSMLWMSGLPSLLFFGIYLPTLMLFTIAHEGALHWFSPVLPIGLHEPLYIVSYFATLFFALLITRHYLDLSTKSKKLDMAVIFLAAVLPLAPISIIMADHAETWVNYLFMYSPAVVALIGTALGLIYAFTTSLPHSFWLSYLALLGSYGALTLHSNLLPVNNEKVSLAFLVAIGVHVILLCVSLMKKIHMVLQQRFDREESQKQRQKRESEERDQRMKLIQQYENKVKEQEKEYLQELRKQDFARKNELLVAKREAERANEAKSDFLAMISHEIRTPLTGILGMVQLTSQSPLNDQQREYIDTIQYSGETLLALLNDILDFSKIEKGKLELEIITINLEKLLKSVLMLMTGRAGEKGVELKLDIQEGIPTHVQGDPTRIRQILLNLINNAIKFTEKGSVTLKVEKVSDNGKFIDLKYSVIDTGIGISAEAKARLFSAYSQADESISRKYGGTGLGLSICKKLISSMSGKIDVDSVEGQGSTFWFVIPMDITKQQEYAEEGSSEGAENLKPLKILCVDDNEINTKVIAGLLSKNGHTVSTETVPLKALDTIRHETFDVILADMKMPQMTGPELAQAVRELTNSQKANTPIIALTGNASQDDMAICHRAGMNDFLVKPVAVEALTRTLAAVIDGKGRFDTRPTPPEPEVQPEETAEVQSSETVENKPHELPSEHAEELDASLASPQQKPSFEEQQKEKQAKATTSVVHDAPSFDEVKTAPKQPIQEELKNTVDNPVESEITEIVTPMDNENAPEDKPQDTSPKKKGIKDIINSQIAFLDMGTVDDITDKLKKSTMGLFGKAKDAAQNSANLAKEKFAEQTYAKTPTQPEPVEKPIEPQAEPMPEPVVTPEPTVDIAPPPVPEPEIQPEPPIEQAPAEPVQMEMAPPPAPEPVEQPVEPMPEPVVTPEPTIDIAPPLAPEPEVQPEPPVEQAPAEPVQMEMAPPPAPEPVEQPVEPQPAPMPEPVVTPEPTVDVAPPPVPEPEIQPEPPVEQAPAEPVQMEMAPPPAPEPVEQPVEPQAEELEPIPFEAPKQILDEKMVKDLSVSLGMDTFVELYDELWTKADSIIEILNTALAEKNMKTINERGHEIKGMCANFGIVNVSSVARDIEQSGMSQDYRTASSLIPHLPELLAQARQIIQDFIDGKIALGMEEDEEDDGRDDYMI